MNGRLGAEASQMQVVVADGTPKVRSALRLLVEQDEAMNVSFEAKTADELMEQVRMTCPEIILLDCDLPGLQTGEFLPRLRSFCPRVQVVALTNRPELRRAALTAGADAFVSKTEPPEKLLAVLRLCVAAVRRMKGGESPAVQRSIPTQCHEISQAGVEGG